MESAINRSLNYNIDRFGLFSFLNIFQIKLNFSSKCKSCKQNLVKNHMHFLYSLPKVLLINVNITGQLLKESELPDK